MSSPLRALLLATILGIAASAQGQINIVNFDFGAVPIICSDNFAYGEASNSCIYGTDPRQNFNTSPGFGWILGAPAAWQVPANNLNGAGLIGPYGGSFQPPPFDGLFKQAVFLQNNGSFVWQEVGGFSVGKYTLSFYLGSRYIDSWYDGNQTVVALIDGVPIGTWVLSSYTPFTLQTANFTVATGGKHTVEFMGTRPGDHTAFLSYVVITPTQHPQP